MTDINVSTSDLVPKALVDAIKSEALDLAREGRTRTFVVEFRTDGGPLHEARLRTREKLIVIPLVASTSPLQ